MNATGLYAPRGPLFFLSITRRDLKSSSAGARLVTPDDVSGSMVAPESMAAISRLSDALVLKEMTLTWMSTVVSGRSSIT